MIYTSEIILLLYINIRCLFITITDVLLCINISNVYFLYIYPASSKQHDELLDPIYKSIFFL